MRIHHWLWLLWGTMIFSMFWRWKIDTYMVVALIILPILIVLLELQEEVTQLKEEAKHQRKFVMERFGVLSEKITDLATNVEKKMVVDFTEFARDNPPTRGAPGISPGKKLKKKKKVVPSKVDLAAVVPPSEPPAEEPSPEKA